jgi:hypothetical protein
MILVVAVTLRKPKENKMGVSNYRPHETVNASFAQPRVAGLVALRMIRDSIAKRPGLIRGKLNGKNGTHCALGCFWADHEELAIKAELTNEIAKVNDSVARDPKKRREAVLKWLDRKIAALSASDRGEKR